MIIEHNIINTHPVWSHFPFLWVKSSVKQFLSHCDCTRVFHSGKKIILECLKLYQEKEKKKKQDLRYTLNAYPECLMFRIIWHSQSTSVSKAN